MYAGAGGKPGNNQTEPLTKKISWEYSLKWKPPDKNTIDFLVRYVDPKTPHISNIYKSIQTTSTTKTKTKEKTFVVDNNGIFYQMIELFCGYSRHQHGFLHSPFTYLVNDIIPSFDTREEKEDLYRPVLFLPSSPLDPYARYCYVPLSHQEAAMILEDGTEYFDQNMIVEFRYDLEQRNWIPIRVRHDKTAMLRSNHRCYGNDYRTANQVWETIQHPITLDMLTSNLGIPTTLVENEVYYLRDAFQKSNVYTSTKSLRDFHNLFVKRSLLVGTKQYILDQSNGKSKNTNEINTSLSITLLDLSVGKAGDLPKWCDGNSTQNTMDFVLGIDLMEDNITNHVDGACARYIQEKMKSKYPMKFKPFAMFVQGDCRKLIRASEASTMEGETKGSPIKGAFHDENGNLSKYGEIVDVIFGNGVAGEALRRQVGPGVYKLHNIVKDGFHITSCQFAMHYFFENVKSVHTFMRNIHDCTQIGGFFLGTCFDGESIFKKLKDIPFNGKYVLMNSTNGNKIVEITKKYKTENFGENEESNSNVGYPIHVFQESIHQGFDEYLVHEIYLRRLMTAYGFMLVSNEVAQKIVGIPKGTATFEELFEYMLSSCTNNEKTKNTTSTLIWENFKSAPNMSKEEKICSFLNRYYIFQKMHHVQGGSQSVQEKMEGMLNKKDLDDFNDLDKIEKQTDDINQSNIEKQDIKETNSNTTESTVDPDSSKIVNVIISRKRKLVPTKVFSIIGVEKPTTTSLPSK